MIGESVCLFGSLRSCFFRGRLVLLRGHGATRAAHQASVRFAKGCDASYPTGRGTLPYQERMRPKVLSHLRLCVQKRSYAIFVYLKPTHCAFLKRLKAWCSALSKEGTLSLRAHLKPSFSSQVVWRSHCRHQAEWTPGFEARTTTNVGLSCRIYADWQALTHKWIRLDRCTPTVPRFRATPNERYAWVRARFEINGITQDKKHTGILGEFEGLFDLKFNQMQAIEGRRFQRVSSRTPFCRCQSVCGCSSA